MKTNPKDQQAVLQAAADLGRANGIALAAKIVAGLANHKGRVVGTNEIRQVVAEMTEEADKMRARAKDTLALYRIILS